MNALANKQVGEYVNEHFVTAYQKVGTFRVVNGQKQGGNVASYFCLPDGTVIHAIAGPVDAATFLQEARFAVETHKLASASARNDRFRYKRAVRTAHQEKLRDESGAQLPPSALPGVGYASAVTDKPLRMAQACPRDSMGKMSMLSQNRPFGNQHMMPALPLTSPLGNKGKVSALLAAYPLARLEAFYPVVWEKVLHEKLSAAPVLTARR